MKNLNKSLIAALMFGAVSASALELTSEDIAEGQHMSRVFEYSGWGCEGSNLSPQLSWSNAPAGTKSYVITAYDPDAPTGSGFWHWVAVDIPAGTTNLSRGEDMSKLGAKLIMNDFGTREFGGACPPVGHGMHRYQFTVWAMPSEKMELDKNATPAVVGFYLNNLALDKQTLTATFHR